MKNLKKVLALGLALVMILGMFTVAFAAETEATEFPDWDEVQNKDAFSLMVTLGVINGTGDGNLAPENNIDRASWAKMLYYVLVGDGDYALYASDYPTLSDISTSWAQGAIEYLYNNGYIDGDGQNYYPTNSITVVEAAKTMLTSLGYSSKVEGYVGNGWTTNVMSKAKNIGLLEGIGQGQSDAITRDNATQMIYNALSANMVTYGRAYNANTDSYVPDGNITEHDTLGVTTFGVQKVTALVTGVTDGKAEFATGTGYDDILTGSVSAKASDIGNTVTVWVDVNNNSVVTDTVISNGSAADKTFTGGVTIADITDPDADDYVAAAVDGGYLKYEDGVKGTLAESYVSGNVVEVYLTDGKVSMIKATTYKVMTVDGDPETRTYKDALQVRIAGIDGAATWKAAEDVVGYEGLEEGDVVLVNNSNGVITLEKAAVVTGTVSRKSAGKLTINGTQYAQSGIADGVDFANWDVAGEKANEYNFYLDKNGDVCFQEQISGETSTEVAYVLQVGYFEESKGSGLSSSTSSHVEAELLFTDGTTKIVTVAAVDGNDELDASVEDEVAGFVDFSVNSKGNYELTTKTSTAVNGPVEITAAAKFAEGYTADTATVFLIAKGNPDDGYEFSVVTGYKNVPGMTADVMDVVVDEVATYVYVETEKFSGDGSDGLIYIIDANAYDEDVDGSKVYEIVDAEGNETTMALEGAVATGFAVIDSIDEDGVATVKAVGSDVAVETGIKAGNGILTVASGTVYEYDDTTVVVIIDLDGADFVSASTVAAKNIKLDTDGYTYEVRVLDADGVAEYVYITCTEA